MPRVESCPTSRLSSYPRKVRVLVALVLRRRHNDKLVYLYRLDIN